LLADAFGFIERAEIARTIVQLSLEKTLSESLVDVAPEEMGGNDAPVVGAPTPGADKAQTELIPCQPIVRARLRCDAPAPTRAADVTTWAPMAQRVAVVHDWAL
jgi:hypothetical protein